MTNSDRTYNLAMYLPLTIAVLSALVMATRNSTLLGKVVFFPGLSDLYSEPWRFLTYAFFEPHRPLSLLFTTLFLWWVGTPVEQQYGSRIYIFFFLVCTVTAAVGALFANALFPGSRTGLLGPGAMLWGATWIFSRINPEQQFFFMFVIPVKARYFPFLLIGFRLLFTGISLGTQTIPAAALIIAVEILGAVAGVLFLHLIGNRRRDRTLHISLKTKKMEETSRLQATAAGEGAAKPLLQAASRIEAGKGTARDAQLLTNAVQRTFDFTVCPLTDFDREDEYCKRCVAYPHCLAKELTKNQDS